MVKPSSKIRLSRCTEIARVRGMGGTESADRSNMPRWITSWKPQSVLLVFFLLSLIFGPLQSSAPLLGIYFPGAFIAMSAWGIISDVANWDHTNRPLRAVLPVPVYLVAATTTLFVAYVLTDRTAYRHGALVSLIMTIPFAGAGVLIAMLRHRFPGGRDGAAADPSDNAA
jgi:hypothetical protein